MSEKEDRLAAIRKRIEALEERLGGTLWPLLKLRPTHWTWTVEEAAQINALLNCLDRLRAEEGGRPTRNRVERLIGLVADAEALVASMRRPADVN